MSTNHVPTCFLSPRFSLTHEICNLVADREHGDALDEGLRVVHGRGGRDARRRDVARRLEQGTPGGVPEKVTGGGPAAANQFHEFRK